MTDTRDWRDPSDEPWEEVEAMVRAAGQYVAASDDLRPRVLETARTECGEQRAQRIIRQAAIAVVLTAMLTLSGDRGLDSVGASRQLADSQSIFSRAASSGDAGWGMVDAFRELRHEQAKALRVSL